jgi:UDP-N-acetylmuramoylalanine--D-glutamate ligase
LRITPESIAGLNVTVMGLGLHGGGLASVRFFAERGADVTATDLRDETTLRPTLDRLKDLDVRFVLGRHDIEDFRKADLVIKNPAVRPDSPFLKAASRTETDISVFLQLHNGPVYAVTGTKGKSTTASAIHHILRSTEPRALLGGNITVSPLGYISSGAGTPQRDPPIVLELSSWQLADLRGRGVLHPEVALITNILRDHQNHYASMEDYIADKMVILEAQKSGAKAIVNHDDPRLSRCTGAPGVTVLPFSSSPLPPTTDGGFLQDSKGMFRYRGEEHTILDSMLLKGDHNRINLLCAALCCVCNGVPAETARRELRSFTGVEHRLEFVRNANGVEFYNDSAATIPDATIAAVDSFDRNVTLISGGTDKDLDFALFAGLGGGTKAIYLLAGNATEKMIAVLDAHDVPYQGPFTSLEILMECIMQETVAGDIVVFSPGCASFGMFKNEFDRGTRYKAIVKEL